MDYKQKRKDGVFSSRVEIRSKNYNKEKRNFENPSCVMHYSQKELQYQYSSKYQVFQHSREQHQPQGLFKILDFSIIC